MPLNKNLQHQRKSETTIVDEQVAYANSSNFLLVSSNPRIEISHDQQTTRQADQLIDGQSIIGAPVHHQDLRPQHLQNQPNVRLVRGSDCINMFRAPGYRLWSSDHEMIYIRKTLNRKHQQTSWTILNHQSPCSEGKTMTSTSLASLARRNDQTVTVTIFQQRNVQLRYHESLGFEGRSSTGLPCAMAMHGCVASPITAVASPTKAVHERIMNESVSIIDQHEPSLFITNH